jgi:SNF2 family DNA or RNA helicase
LLSKATEYSSFIANDLAELQANMELDAKRAVSKMEKKKAKGERPSKKLKTSKGAVALESAQAKDAVIRAGSKPIFAQPPNLSTDCQLKDYQLVGVRWLASLYENGVSGILADEM